MIDTRVLRKNLLSLAVTGKLTVQRKSDVPVSDAIKEYIPKIDTELPEIPVTWRYCKFDDLLINRDSERIPVSVADRKKLDKVYDYYGASGVIDKVDSYLFDETLLLIGEDGANLLSRSTPIAFLAHGKYWVNNHAHVLAATEHILLKYAEIVINSMSLVPYVTGAAQPKLSQSMMNKIAIPVPPIEEQQRIVDVLEEAFKILDRIDELQRLFSVDIEILKSKLVEAGIQGKLTEQLPEDGTAEGLYVAIQKKKTELYKEGIIKKEKSLPEITDDEVPFEIPSNWKWVRLVDISNKIWAGGDKPSDFSKTATEDLNIPVVANGVAEDGVLGYTRIARAPAETITVAGRGTIGFCVYRDYEYCPIVRLIVIEPAKGIEPRYIKLVMQSMQEGSVGSSIPQLTVPMIKPKLIPLPPYEEQKRIVERIEALLKYI